MDDLERHLKTLRRRRAWLQANAGNTFALAEKAALTFVIDNYFANAEQAEQDVTNEQQHTIPTT